MPSFSASVAIYWSIPNECRFLPSDVTRAQYLERVAIARAKLILAGENPDDAKSSTEFIRGMAHSYRTTAIRLLRALPDDATFLQVIEQIVTVEDVNDVISSTNAIVRAARIRPRQNLRMVSTSLRQRCDSAKGVNHINRLSNELAVQILRPVLCWDEWIHIFYLPWNARYNDKDRAIVRLDDNEPNLKMAASVLRTCKWLNECGNPVLYGENAIVAEPETLVEGLACLPAKKIELIKRIYINPRTKTEKGYKRTLIEQLFRRFNLKDSLRSCWLVAKVSYRGDRDTEEKPLRKLHDALKDRGLLTPREGRAGLGIPYFDTPVGNESSDLESNEARLMYAVLFDDRDNGKLLPGCL